QHRGAPAPAHLVVAEIRPWTMSIARLRSRPPLLGVGASPERNIMRERSLVSAMSILLIFGANGCMQDVDPGQTQEAITHGAVDGHALPAVVLIIMDVDGQPAFRCSGTFLAPKVVLTAGHCAGEPGEFSGLRVFTESDVQNGNNNYPFAGPNTIEAVAWTAHPQFTEAQLFLHDVGV